MSRKCMITGKAPMSGNNVSHSKRRTRRRFMPNIQNTKVYSVALGRWVPIRSSVAGLRTLDHKGGLDAFIMKTPVAKLHEDLRGLKKQIETAQEKRKAA